MSITAASEIQQYVATLSHRRRVGLGPYVQHGRFIIREDQIECVLCAVSCALGRVHTDNFTRRAYRSRTVRVGFPVYTLRRVRPVHSDQIGRCSQWTRTVRVGLALQCECSSGRVGYGRDAPSAHVCRLNYFYPLH